jgi:hypothetical protein
MGVNGCLIGSQSDRFANIVAQGNGVDSNPKLSHL